MNSYLEYLCSKIRLRWFGANNYEVSPLVDEDYEATIKEMQEMGWTLEKRTDHSVLMSFKGETVTLEKE